MASFAAFPAGLPIPFDLIAEATLKAEDREQKQAIR
jgi:hypothetical protein